MRKEDRDRETESERERDTQTDRQSDRERECVRKEDRERDINNYHCGKLRLLSILFETTAGSE